MSKYTLENIARVAHQLNKAYCEMLGDFTQRDWHSAPEWQKMSAVYGVEFHHQNPDAGPEASHNSWMAQKKAEGWVYGLKKDEILREHPCMVPFNELPLEQQVKDELFKAVCNILEKLPVKKIIYLVDRLKEPGSHRALMFLAGIFQVPGVEIDNWMGVATMISGCVAIFLPEGNK